MATIGFGRLITTSSPRHAREDRSRWLRGVLARTRPCDRGKPALDASARTAVRRRLISVVANISASC
jgi:hypothetical protein